jgi:hypothetical protein
MDFFRAPTICARIQDDFDHLHIRVINPRDASLIQVNVCCVKYPRVSYTDLDNLICKKSEEEVRSEAEGGEHSEEACAPTCPK